MFGDTSFGESVTQFIEHNKKAVALLALLLVLGVVGWGVYRTQSGKNVEQWREKIFTFEKERIGLLKSKALAPSALAKELEAFLDEANGAKELLPLAILASDELSAQGASAEATSILVKAKESLDKTPESLFLINARLAVLFEDSGKIDEAISVLEEMGNSKLKIFEGKRFLDLGRLYSKKGDTNKATSSWKHVLDKAQELGLTPQDEVYKLAQLQLQDLSKK